MNGNTEFGINFIIGHSIKLPIKMFLEGKNSLVITSHTWANKHTGYISILHTWAKMGPPPTGVIELIIYFVHLNLSICNIIGNLLRIFVVESCFKILAC